MCEVKRKSVVDDPDEQSRTKTHKKGQFPATIEAFKIKTLDDIGEEGVWKMLYANEGVKTRRYIVDPTSGETLKTLHQSYLYGRAMKEFSDGEVMEEFSEPEPTACPANKQKGGEDDPIPKATAKKSKAKQSAQVPWKVRIKSEAASAAVPGAGDIVFTSPRVVPAAGEAPQFDRTVAKGTPNDWNTTAWNRGHTVAWGTKGREKFRD